MPRTFVFLTGLLLSLVSTPGSAQVEAGAEG